MELSPFDGDGYRLGPRIPTHNGPRENMGTATRAVQLDIPSRIVPRASTTTCSPEDQNRCEKPVSSSALTLPIALGVAVPTVLALAVLIYLHRRGVARVKKEDREAHNKGLDFGLDDNVGKRGKKSKRQSLFGGEKSMGQKQRQLSMDLNMSTPYLLPPKLQQSRESLHSLARSLHNAEDPYRPVAQLSGSEVGSIRSLPRAKDAASVYTSSSGRSGNTHKVFPPPRQNSLPKSEHDQYQHKQAQSPPPRVQTPTTRSQTPTNRAQTPTSRLQSPTTREMAPLPTPPPPPPPPPPAAAPSRDHFNSDTSPTLPHIQVASFPEEQYIAKEPLPTQTPKVQEPSPATPKIFRHERVVRPTERPTWDLPPVPQSATIEMAHPVTDIPLQTSRQQTAPTPPRKTSSGISFHLPMHAITPESPPPPAQSSPPPLNPAHQSPPRVQEPFSAPPEPSSAQEQPQYYDENQYAQGYPEQSYHGHDPQYEYESYEHRGRSAEQEQFDFQQEDNQYLAAPQGEMKRMSVGFRPLPPDEYMDSEDPEERANRIRSFYKEYFDDTGRSGPLPQMPQPPYQDQYYPPQQYPQAQPHHPQQQYYEDYDQNYAPEAAYFDPDSNAFVMPYAEPVTRRAMTPPPRGSRFRGPPPPRAGHGSIGGLSLPGGRGPPRPGSSVSNQWGPRPGSSASGRYGPRPGSSASSRYGRPQNRKPKGPPPSALSTLPNPAKLKDDSFALLNAADFAPPDSFKDRARGRSQSPAGERRPYHLTVPAHSPLVSSFDELAAVPSPHSLRKSGTFTGLDFAPPRRFKEGDTMSDAGSIRSNRSNRSGISAVQSAALRSGAGRVSRLPGDTVFTQAQTAQQLRPQWNMRT